MRRLCTYLICLLTLTPVWAGEEAMGDKARSEVRVSVLVSEPGIRQFYNQYGHAAVRICIPEMDVDYTYSYNDNYRGANFRDALSSLVIGRCKMGLGAGETATYLEGEYRTTYEYPLRVRPEAARRLCAILERERQRGYNRIHCPTEGSCCRMLWLYLTESGICSADSVSWPEDDMTVREVCLAHAGDWPWGMYLMSALVGDREYGDNNEIGRSHKLIFCDQLITKLREAGVVSGEPTLLIAGEVSGRPTPRCLHPVVVAVLLLVLTLAGSRCRPIAWVMAAWWTIVAVALGLFWALTNIPYASPNMVTIAVVGAQWMVACVEWKVERLKG